MNIRKLAFVGPDQVIKSHPMEAKDAIELEGLPKWELSGGQLYWAIWNSLKEHLPLATKRYLLKGSMS